MCIIQDIDKLNFKWWLVVRQLRVFNFVNEIYTCLFFVSVFVLTELWIFKINLNNKGKFTLLARVKLSDEELKMNQQVSLIKYY